MCLMIRQSFEEGGKDCFIDDILDARRQCCPCTFQHLETPLTLETLQHKNSAINLHNPKYINKKFPYLKKKKTFHNQYPTKMSPLPNLSHIHTTTKFCYNHAKRFLHAKKKFPQLHAQINSTYPTTFFHNSLKICQYP